MDARPGEGTYLLNRASALARTGRRAEAMEHLTRALENEPGLATILDAFPEFGPLLQDPRLRPGTVGWDDES